LADGRVVLDAATDLALLSAEEDSSFSSSNKNSSNGFGVGVNIGVGAGGEGIGLSVNAHASSGKGEGHGDGTTHVETIISGGEGVEFSSGNDTTLKGAQIIGGEVIGTVGGLSTVGANYNTQKQQGDCRVACKTAVPSVGCGNVSRLFQGLQERIDVVAVYFDSLADFNNALQGIAVVHDELNEENRLPSGREFSFPAAACAG
jgi:filamentous hemagglutinin